MVCRQPFVVHQACWILAGLLVAAVVTCGCNNSGNRGTGNKSGGLSGEVEIDGSSTVYRLSVGAYELFREENPQVNVTVNYTGTGAGFSKFVEGKLDIADASRPIDQSEIDKAKANGVEYLELPVAFDALTVAVNVENDWADAMTVEELKKLWEPAAKDKIMRWNQIRPEWPDKPISLFGAGHDSGTFDYFTEAIIGKKGSIRSDATATEDDNIIVGGVAGDQYALGYLPYAYYEPNKRKLKAVKIDWKPDDEAGPIAPSPETVTAGTYNPLSRPLFLYVNKKSAERPEVKAFVEFYLAHAKELCEQLQYVPLPNAAYEMAQLRLAEMKSGTGFGGKSEFGMPIEEVLQRPPQ